MKQSDTFKSASQADSQRDKHAEAPLDQTLALVLPWELMEQETLQADEYARLEAIMTPLWDALQSNSQAHLAILAQLLSQLDDVVSDVAQVSATGTALAPDEVSDFDQYFGVAHVETPSKALLLLKGLIQTAHASMALCLRNEDFPAQAVEQQLAGYRCYVELMQRSFVPSDSTQPIEPIDQR